MCGIKDIDALELYDPRDAMMFVVEMLRILMVVEMFVTSSCSSLLYTHQRP